MKGKRKSKQLLPVDRSGQVSPEYKQWKESVARPRIRRFIEELPYEVGYIEQLQLQRLVTTQFIMEFLANKIIAGLRQDGELDPALHAHYIQYSKLVKEQEGSLLLTPASRHNAAAAQNRSDAFALLGEARRQILARREPEPLPALPAE